MNLRKVFLILSVLTVSVTLAYIFTVRGKVGTGGTLFQNQTLPALGQAPPFYLIDQEGRAFDSSSLQGKPWVGDFIFTRCQGQCPIMSQQMSRLQNEAPNLRLLSFSVDPDYDKPALLEAYGKTYGAKPGHWTFLTGPKDALSRIAVAFKMNALGEPMFHSSSFVLVDGQGQVRGYYDANDSEKMNQLIRDAKKVS